MSAILVYLDPGEDNLPVLTKARRLSQMLYRPLVLMSVVYNATLARSSRPAGQDADSTRDAFIEAHRETLVTYADDLKSQGLSVDVCVLWHKNAWQGMREYLQQGDFDLIVKGTHHQNVVQRTLFSSTDWDLIRCSPLPVLLVQRYPWPQDNLLLTACVDPVAKEDSPQILDKATVLQAKVWQSAMNARLEVLNVYDPTPFIVYMDPPVPDTTPITEALAEQHRDALNQLLADCGLENTQGHLESGTPATTIPELLHEHGTHVAVLGAQTREGINRWLIGHTAEKVLDRIHCDILVIKTDQHGR